MKPWTIIHVALAVIHALVGALVWALMEDGIEKTRQMVYESQSVIVDDGGDDFSIDVEQHDMFRVSPIEIHAFVSVLTAVSHLASAWKYRNNSDGVAKNRPNVVRWTEYAITATLITLSGTLTVGQGDLFGLVTLIILGVSLQVCGYYIEKNVESKQWWPFMILGGGIEAAIVTPITLWTLTARNARIGILDAWIAYFIYYALFPLNAWLDTKRPNDFQTTDKIYVILSFTSKMALLWITVGALMANVTDGEEEKGWIAVVRVAEAVPAAFLVACYVWLRRDKGKTNKAEKSATKARVANLVF